MRLLLVPDPTAPNGHDGFCNALAAHGGKRGHKAEIFSREGAGLAELLKQADLVLVNGLQPELAEAVGSGRKAVWRMVEAWPGDERRVALASELARKADLVLVPSRFLEGIMRGWGRTGPVRVVPYAYEHIMAQQVAVVTVRSTRNSIFPIVAGGAINPATLPGFEVLFSALARLRLDWHLNLFGDGPSLPALRQRAKEYLITDRITFLGDLPLAKVLEYFRSAKALVDPCCLEGFPTQALHGLSEGCPVVAAKAGAIEELIENNVNGLLYAPRDPAALAEAIVTLYSVRGLSLRLIAAGIKTVERHSWEATMQAAFEAIESVQ